MASRTCWNVPQRQILVMPASMSASVGFGLSFRRAATAMIMPDWQKPHCGTWYSSQACCTLWRVPPVARPSMVVICLPSAAATGITQDRTAAPSRCTVHAPHCATPQPYFVPVRPACSRIAHSRGVLGLTSTSRALPLTVKRAICSLLGDRGPAACWKYPRLGARRQAILQPEGSRQGTGVTRRGESPISIFERLGRGAVFLEPYGALSSSDRHRHGRSTPISVGPSTPPLSVKVVARSVLGSGAP